MAVSTHALPLSETTLFTATEEKAGVGEYAEGQQEVLK